MYSHLFEQIYAKTHLYFHIGSSKIKDGKIESRFTADSTQVPSFFVMRKLQYLMKTSLDSGILHVLLPKKVLKIFNILNKQDRQQLHNYLTKNNPRYLQILENAISSSIHSTHTYSSIEQLTKQIYDLGFDGFMVSEYGINGNIGVFKPNECFKIIDWLSWKSIIKQEGKSWNIWIKKYEPLLHTNEPYSIK